MKIVQRHPLHFNMTTTFELLDDRVVYSWKAWNGSGKSEYPLSIISPMTSVGTHSNKTLSNYGFFFVFCFMVSSFLGRLFFGDAVDIFTFGALAIACIFGIAYLVLREEYEVFRNTTGIYLLGIKDPSKPAEVKFIEELKSRINA